MAIVLHKPAINNAKQRNAILDELDEYLNGCIAVSQLDLVYEEKADLIKLLEDDDALKPNKMASSIEQLEQIIFKHIERLNR